MLIRFQHRHKVSLDDPSAQNFLLGIGVSPCIQSFFSKFDGKPYGFFWSHHKLQ